MKFPKDPETIAQQITRLKGRGLVIDNEVTATHQLSNISYYRLSAYFLPFQENDDPNHRYRSSATFEKVMNLYQFDRELRIITLDAIERIEIAIRCKIVNEYCLQTNNINWYEDARHYDKNFDYIIFKVRHVLSRSNEVFIKHYYSKYTSPSNPPSWMAMEILSFGQLSILYKHLLASPAKKAVAKHFGVDYHILESWMEHLSYVRNICAHHGRLWNRVLIIAPTIPKRPGYNWINISPHRTDKVYISLCIIGYLTKRISPTSYFTGKLKTLMHRLPEINLTAAGFPRKWQSDAFWKSNHVSFSYRLRIWIFTIRNLLNQII